MLLLPMQNFNANLTVREWESWEENWVNEVAGEENIGNHVDGGRDGDTGGSDDGQWLRRSCFTNRVFLESLN